MSKSQYHDWTLIVIFWTYLHCKTIEGENGGFAFDTARKKKQPKGG